MGLTPTLTVAREFDRLEPAIRPEIALESIIHGKLDASATLPLGQVLAQVTLTPGLWRAHSGLTGPRRRLLVYPMVTDAAGRAYLGTALPPAGSGGDMGMDSAPMYFAGYFFVKDLVGITSDADVAELGTMVQGVAWNDPTAIVFLS